MSEQLYLLNILDRNFTLETKYGKMIRTPIKFHIKESEKTYWTMQLAMKGIRNYTIYKLIETPVEVVKEPPIVTVQEELIRPSSRNKKDS